MTWYTQATKCTTKLQDASSYEHKIYVYNGHIPKKNIFSTKYATTATKYVVNALLVRC